jgi:hypothetical protein
MVADAHGINLWPDTFDNPGSLVAEYTWGREDEPLVAGQNVSATDSAGNYANENLFGPQLVIEFNILDRQRAALRLHHHRTYSHGCSLKGLKNSTERNSRSTDIVSLFR